MKDKSEAKRQPSGSIMSSIFRAVGMLLIVAVLLWVLVPTPVPAVQQHRIPVYYWHMWSGPWLPVMNNVVDEFNKSQDKYVVIPLQIPPMEGDQKFLLSVAGGNPPDLMAQWTSAIDTWAQAGVLQPLDTNMTPAEHDYFVNQTYPVIHDNGWYKNHLYGMVMGVDVYACYYKPADFRKAGLDPNKFPTTLENLTKLGLKLDETDAAGNLTRAGFLPSTLTSYVPSFGGSFYDAKTGRLLLDTPQNLRALKYVVDSQRAIGIDRIQRFVGGEKSQQGAEWPFIQGQFAITLDGEWRVKQMADYAPGMDYRVASLPPPSGGVPLASYSVTNFLTIPVGARHSAGAWAFLKFWSGLDDPERAAKFNTEISWLPNSPREAESPDYQAFLKKYPQYETFVRLAASKNLVTIPPVPYQLFLSDKITTDDDLAERGVISPEQALARLEREVADERARRKELGYDQ